VDLDHHLASHAHANARGEGGVKPEGSESSFDRSSYLASMPRIFLNPSGSVCLGVQAGAPVATDFDKVDDGKTPRADDAAAPRDNTRADAADRDSGRLSTAVNSGLRQAGMGDATHAGQVVTQNSQHAAVPRARRSMYLAPASTVSAGPTVLGRMTSQRTRPFFASQTSFEVAGTRPTQPESRLAEVAGNDAEHSTEERSLAGASPTPERVYMFHVSLDADPFT
jgi:hypothetical protein